MMKYFVTLFLFQLFFLHSSAQVDREMPPDAGSPELRFYKNRVYGKLLDSKTGKGLEAASVQLFAVTKLENGNSKDSLVAVMLTKPNGDFSFEDIPAADTLLVMISVTGYKPIVKRVAVENRRRDEGPTAIGETDLGNLVMEADIQQLGNVTVIAQKPALVMGIDRKIFNVDKSLVATGGTGLDVMKNIPSVSVDVDGNVTLRNNTPQIFVDGRPTILTLDQIPADHIERVELITNPSAKFDASSGAGIINVILKKNKKLGLNGMVTAGAGTPNQLNGNVNVSLREGKMNYFVSGGFNQSGGLAASRALRQNKDGNVIENYFNQYTDNDRLRRFASLRFGADYFIDNRNTISLSQNMFKGKRTNEEDQDQESLDMNKQLVYIGKRYSYSRSDFRRNNTQLNYKHNFPEQGKELTAGITYNYGSGEENTEIVNTYFYPDGSPYTAPTTVRNDGNNDSDQWTMEIDFIDPNGEDDKMETGIRSYINNFRSTFNAFSVNNGSETKLPLSNNYKYSEMVNAFYITWTKKIKSFGYQLGLRTEHSQFTGELIDSARKFGYEYPNRINRIWDAMFPSVFITKTFGENVEVQANYSRRIRRPNFWQLNPFIDINDPMNLRQGNPELRPEFINSFEFNYSHNFGRGNNFLGVIYYRNNPGDITRYSDTITTAQYQQLNNAGVDPNAILNTFINAQATNRLGAEFTWQQKLGKNFDFTPTIDLQYRKVKANFGTLDLNNEGFSWEGKLILNYRTTDAAKPLVRNLGLQLIGEYESSEVVPQGRRTPEYSIDFALRKDFLKDKKATFTFSINDVFNTQRWGSIYDTETFYQDSYWRRNVRGFRVVLSYKFGDAEFSFRRGNRGGGGGGEGDDD